MGMLHITCLRLNTSPRAFGPQAGIQSQASNMQHRPKKSRYCVNSDDVKSGRLLAFD